MRQPTFTKSGALGIALLVTLMVPAAHAEAPSQIRDLALKVTIASQGNQALMRIRADSTESLREQAPELPAPEAVLRTACLAGAGAPAAAVRSAE